MTKHESQRGYFAYELHQQMQKNEDIWLLCGDLGYLVFDKIRDDFPDRFINTGAAETSLLDIGVGLALGGKIPFCYSITTFLIYRPFEVLRTYIDHENIPVKLIGSGRNRDYKHDGFSHDATDIPYFLNGFTNIKQYYPTDKEYLPKIVDEMIHNNKPTFLSLTR